MLPSRHLQGHLCSLARLPRLAGRVLGLLDCPGGAGGQYSLSWPERPP